MKPTILVTGASGRTDEHAGTAAKKPILRGISVGAGT
jgi:hypothetical protein